MAHNPSPFVFIDSQVPSYRQLIEELIGQIRLQVISAEEDGVAAISARLRQEPADTVVIVAHGAPGQLSLGRSVLGLETLDRDAALIQAWFSAAIPHPQLHLYGCQVAAGDAGAEFLAKLHHLTGAGIAASPRLVGHGDLGGDWRLDATVGAVDTVNVVSPGFAQHYRATLAADNFANATVWSTANNTGTTAGATHEPGEPIHDPNVSGLTQTQQQNLNNSIWWQWTAPTTGLITADTLGSALSNTVLAVYTGGAVNSLNQVAFNDNISSSQFRSRVTFNAVAGVTYYFAVDGVGTQTGGVQLNINTAPQITPNQSFNIAENAALGDTLGTLTANETGLTWSIVSGNPDNDSDGNRAFALNPTTGVLTVNDPGDLNFEVFPNTYSLVVRATDSGGLSSEQTVTINVLDAPDPPIITSLTTSQSTINEGSQLTLSGVFNDPDFDDIHTVTIAWGDGVIDVISNDNLSPRDANGNRSFTNLRHTYQDNGQYTITVTVVDDGGLSATRTTTVAVNNVPPTITQGATLELSVNEDNPTTFTLNATDPGRLDILTWSILNQPANGIASVSTSPTGRTQIISYVPNANFAGTDTFEVQVADDDGGFDTIVVTMTVVPQPDPPTNLNLTGNVDTLNEGGTFILSGSFSDPDVGDSFTVTINWGDGSPATVIPNSDITSLGNGNYTFTTSHVYRADSGAGQFSVSAIVRDSDNLTVSDTLSVTVLNVPPTITQGPFLALSTPEDNALTFTLNATDPADTNFQWTVLTGPANGTVTFTTNPNGPSAQTLVYTPNANFDQLDSFQIQVGDGDGGFSVIDVLVNVEPVNDPPTNLTITPNVTTLNEGSTITLNGSFVDVDTGDTHTVTINWGDGTVTTLTAVDLIQTGTTYTLPPLTHVYVDDGNFTLTVTVEDAEGATASRTQAITVNNVPPLIANAAGDILGATLTLPPGQEDVPITFGLRGIDPGINDILQWSIVSGPSQGTVTILPPVAGEPQEFLYTPNPNVFGPDSFTIRLIDGDGGVDTLVVNLTLAAVNDLPVITANQFTITEGVPLLITQANLNATDIETFDPNLRFSISNLAPGERFAVEGGVDNFFTLADIIAGRVTFFNNGTETPPAFDITVEDDNAPPGITTAPANITFITVNDPPEIVNNSFPVTEGLTTIISPDNLRATDEESPDSTLVYTVTRIAGGTVRVSGVVQTTFTQGDIDTGRVTFVHDGSETIPILEFTVSDGELFTPGIAVIDYTPVNDPPQLLANSLTITEGDTILITLQDINATDVDNDDNGLQFSVTDLDTSIGVFQRRNPATGDFENANIFTRGDIVNGNVRFVHFGAEIAPAYTITVRDPAGLSDSSAANVTFIAVNDPPVWVNNLLTIFEGESIILSDTNILATDEESGPADLTITVSGLSGGRFEFVTAPGVAITSFTQADISNSRVRFVHDGGEDAPAYTLTVSDGELSVTEAATIAFTNVNDPPQLLANSLTITEGDTILITLQDIDATDVDNDDNGLQFSVTGLDTSIGVFQRRDPATGIFGDSDTFTRGDIVNGNVRFVHFGAEVSPAYTLTVSDPEGLSDSSVATVTFIAVNDPPVWVNNLLTIFEGESLILSDTNILATDEESGPADLTITVSGLSGGRFEFVTAPGVAITSFTQADISNSRVRFVHDGGEDAPAYTLTVSDGELSVTEAATIAFTNVNDPPVFLANTLTLTEGDTVVLTTANLNATDIESADADLVFTILEVRGGRFEFTDGTLIADAGGSAQTFTLEDIILNRVRFVQPPADKETVPFYRVAVTDDDPTDPRTTESTATINFTPVNDPPVIVTNTLTITEGGVALFSDGTTAAGGILSSTDPETAAGLLVYTISNVVGGQFELVNTPGVAVTTFTQAQITDRQVRFVQNGTSTIPNYTVTVRDPEGLTATDTPLVSFTDFNDPPVITRNVLTITEGQTLVLGSANIEAVDEESGPAQLTYTVSGLVGGQFERVADPGVAITTFTQADINGGAIQFVHDDTETVPSYTLTVTDSGGITDTTPKTATSTVVVDFTRVNDPPVFVTNTLTIDEGATVVLGDANLFATDEESTPAQLTYTVQGVTNGRFELVGSPGEAVTSFTQAQVTAGAVQFVHNGDEAPPTYTLIVTDSEGATATLPATIAFTNVNDPPSFLASQLQVTEGATVVLTFDNLNATDPDHPDDQIQYSVANVVGGEFRLNGVLLPPGDTFTRVDIALGRVVFVDNGDGNPPSFDFVATDPEGAATSVSATITFIPVNDPPQLLVNNFPIVEGDVLVLTTANLNATDQETPDPELVYRVSNVVGGRFFTIGGNEITSFTQAQINAGNQIVFRHNGTETVPSFTLEVIDGDNLSSGLIPAVIDYTPVNDPPVFSRNILTISEGETVLLSTANIIVSDVDTPLSQLEFTILALENGFFTVNGTVLGVGDVFSRNDLVLGRVSFTASDDGRTPAYTLEVSDRDPTDPRTAVRAATVFFTPINDDPIITVNAFTITEGEDLILTTANLNAIDEETSNPAQLTYTMSNIAGGIFFNVATVAAVTTFTQQDINNELIIFRHDGSETPAAFTITLRDPDDGQTIAPGNITFIPVNDPPVITANTFPIIEGEILRITALNLAATDPDNLPAELTFTMTGITGGQFGRDTNDDGLPDQLGITTFTQLEINNGRIFFVHDGNEAAPTFTLSVSDGDLATVPVPGNVAFTNVNDPPSALNFALSADVIDEGNSVLLSGTFFDPDSLTHTITINWGDGTTTTVPSSDIINNGGGNFTLPPTNRTYPGDGNFIVTITVSDGEDSAQTTLPITVNDIPPIVPLSGSDPLRAGQLYTLTIGTPIDPGNDVIVSYRVFWGDGTLTTVTEPGAVTKVYRTSGDYTVSVQVVESNGRTFDVGTVPATVSYPITDFIGNGNADLLWRVNGANVIWALNPDGTPNTGLPSQPLDQNFVVQSTADFNNDGRSDIFWRNAVTGETAIWFMDGALIADARFLPSLDGSWEVGGFADFNNDGSQDLLWRSANGDNAIWLLSGGLPVQGITLPSQSTAFSVAAINDFNGNGFDDILWRNQDTGANLVWLMDGTTFTGQTLELPAVSTSFILAGVDDFNGSGTKDLLWRNTVTGENAIWLMSRGGTPLEGVLLPTVGPNFEVRGISDLNSDGTPDILWRDASSGETVAWAMGNAVPVGVIDFPDPPAGWQVFV